MENFYGFFHYVANVISDVMFRGEVAGLENLPASGPYVIAANHCSHLDPPLLGCKIPAQVRFFARKTLWKPGLPAWWLDHVGTIPVDRDGADVAALKNTIAAVNGGGIVILFPEGTRSPDGKLQAAKAGVGMIACKTGVPVVPARVFGSFEAFGRGDKIPRPHPVTVVVGRPLPPALYDDPSAGKQRYQVASERIMRAIADLVPPRYPQV